MKKTTKEFLEFLGLKVGDRFKIKDEPNREYEIVFETGNGFSLIRRELNLLGTVVIYTSWEYLLDKEYEIVPKPTKLGEMRCTEKECQECPLRMLDCLLDEIGKVTLYEMLDNVCEYRKISKDSDVYKAFKEMLDAKGIISL